MAKVVPSSREDMIAFFAQRVAQWQANATALGVSTTEINSLISLLTTATTDQTTAINARQASKNATVNYHLSTDLLRELGSGIIAVIKARAETTDNPALSALASIPPPAKPAPLGTPDAPTELNSSLQNGGTVALTWKASRAGGTSFRIYRSLKNLDTPAGPFDLIGSTEEKTFIDNTLPAGLQSATYYVVASRPAGNSGNSDVSTLYFGSAAGNPAATGPTTLTIAA